MNRPEEVRSVVSRYLADVRRHPLLTREQEQDVARRAGKGGDGAGLNRLVESNLAFVVKVANEHRNMGLAFEDLLNEGNIGLIEAARRFDPGKGTRFITYAVWYIRKRMMDAIHDQTGVIRVPKYRKRKSRRIHEAEDRLSRELGRRPDRGEISSSLDCARSDVEETLRLRPSVSSLDGDAEDEGSRIRQILADGNVPDPERELLRRERIGLVRWALRLLSEQERRVLSQRAGMDGGPVFTLKEIGERMGLSRERIRQVEEEAGRKLKRILEYLSSPPPDPQRGEAVILPRFARSPDWNERRREIWKSRPSCGSGP